MQRRRSSAFLVILVAGAAAFIWFTGRSLPEIVASHFGASGVANGFMPRATYLRFTLVLVVALPLAVAFLPSIALGNPRARINLPHREYWLAPERRAATVEFIGRHLVRFGSLLVVFLCYVHWLVVRANAVTPPELSSPWFIAGLVFFLASLIAWAAVFLGRFRQAP